MPTFRFGAPREILDPPLHRNCRLKSIGMTKPSLLPPVTEYGKVMFSVMCVCQFMGVGLYVTTMNLLKLVRLATSLSPTQHGTLWSWPWPPTYSLGEIPPQETCSNLFIILYVAHTSISKRVVGLRLKGLLVALVFVVMVVIFNR